MRPGVMATLDLFLETPVPPAVDLPPIRPKSDIMLFFKHYTPSREHPGLKYAGRWLVPKDSKVKVRGKGVALAGAQRCGSSGAAGWGKGGALMGQHIAGLVHTGNDGAWLSGCSRLAHGIPGRWPGHTRGCCSLPLATPLTATTATTQNACFGCPHPPTPHHNPAPAPQKNKPKKIKTNNQFFLKDLKK